MGQALPAAALGLEPRSVNKNTEDDEKYGNTIISEVSMRLRALIPMLLMCFIAISAETLPAASPLNVRVTVNSSGGKVEVGTGNLDWPRTAVKGFLIYEVNIRLIGPIPSFQSRLFNGVSKAEIAVPKVVVNQPVEVWTKYRNGSSPMSEDRRILRATQDNDYHIYLHYDFMTESDVRKRPHTHKPSAAALQMVVDAFRMQNITLSIDPMPGEIPEIRVTTPEAGLTSSLPGAAHTVTLGALSAKYLKQHRREHYMVFAHYNTCDSDERCQQIISSLGGRASEFCADAIAFGTSQARGNSILGSPDSIVSMGFDVDAGLGVIDVIVAGEIMHQLGHNLGLHHGGNSAVDNKPNYISVMNNAYRTGIGVTAQFDGVEAFLASEWNPAAAFGLDYSSGSLPSLHEGAEQYSEDGEFAGCKDDGGTGLNEQHGLPGAVYSFTWAGQTYTQFQIIHFCNFLYGIGGGTAPIDWDFNQRLDSRTFVDLNCDGKCSELSDFNDWSFIKAAIGAGN